MSPDPSILFPTQQKVVDRKYYEAGVRGRFEKNLRVERGSIDTTTPTILSGVGFSVVRNGIGDVTITFDPPFSAVPSIIATPMAPSGTRIASTLAASTTSTARLGRSTSTAFEDGQIDFVAMGP